MGPVTEARRGEPPTLTLVGLGGESSYRPACSAYKLRCRGCLLNTFLFLIVVSECYMAGIVVSSDGRRFRHVPLGIGSLKENVSHDW